VGGNGYQPTIDERPGEAESTERLIAYCRENSRICPMPQQWNKLWELLPDRRRVGGGWEPALPLILAAWHDTSGMQKMLRLAEHIEWAAEHGALGSVAVYLRGLSEEDWFHLGD
jgi:hypothetical protein